MLVNALYCSEEASIVIFALMLILSGCSASKIKGFAYLIVHNVTSLLYLSKSVRIEQ